MGNISAVVFKKKNPIFKLAKIKVENFAKLSISEIRGANIKGFNLVISSDSLHSKY